MGVVTRVVRFCVLLVPLLLLSCIFGSSINYPPKCGELCRYDFWETANVGRVEAELDSGVDINGAKGTEFNSPLHLAIRYGAEPELIELILKRGADPNASGYGTLPSHHGYLPTSHRTPLQMAIEQPNRPVAIIRLLLEYGADPNPPTDYDFYDESPLFYASRFWYKNDAQIIELLLNYGADVNARTVGGLTPLHRAAYEADPETLQVLLAHGADIHARTHPDNARLGGSNTTVLHLAAESNINPDSIAILLNHGADVNARTYGGVTPLHNASRYNSNPDVVLMLLLSGADVNERDWDGSTPLDWALMHGKNDEVVTLLKNWVAAENTDD